MEIIAWLLIILCFIVAFIGLVYPIIPSVLFLLLGFLLYGLFFSFAELSWWFWLTEILFVILLFAADTLANLVSVKKFGGTKAGLWGSTIGLLLGPFVIPFLGILIGPFLGAVIGEFFFAGRDFYQAVRAGIGSLVGFLTSVATKSILQLVMIIIFLIAII
ncbi:DUF456 family protein [Ureibacillus sp. FSL K6-8385]|uniref:DUF456 family protein n=1 Tax=Ureibacillus terrenus TaxID=118246 RepID=A0A540V6B8_9BACL|nr:DUF456 family protein [Ureibacillus terrenus]MED3660716.1 DUF456 family protein [Ureibacillus terrenus]MED3762902.1 DUF456 family protein [Ureibacillus terrenus]TQE92296.1 DUF456 family protein [Ureibacillus terrenus]